MTPSDLTCLKVNIFREFPSTWIYYYRKFSSFTFSCQHVCVNQINHQIICDCNHMHTLFFTVFLKYKCPAFRWHADLCEILPHDLNEVRHGEVNDVVPPGQLQHHVRMQQVIGCKQAGSKALFPAFFQEPLKQIFRQLSILRLGSVQHGILGNAETHTYYRTYPFRGTQSLFTS